jgi:hypothetical protein
MRPSEAEIYIGSASLLSTSADPLLPTPEHAVHAGLLAGEGALASDGRRRFRMRLAEKKRASCMGSYLILTTAGILLGCVRDKINYIHGTTIVNKRHRAFILAVIGFTSLEQVPASKLLGSRVAYYVFCTPTPHT